MSDRVVHETPSTRGGMAIDRDVMVPMRDGVRLATDVFRPLDEGAHPVLILRTPYGKDEINLVSTLLFSPEDAVARGYGVVVQDVRGTGGSDGSFDPYRQERDDGHDAAGWVLEQAWCNGALGVYGASYMGTASLDMLIDGPLEVRAALAYLAPVNHHAEAYVDGLFDAGKNVRWAIMQAAAQIARGAPDGRNPDDARAEADRYLRDPEAFLGGSWDLSKAVTATAEWMPFIADYLRHPQYDAYWEQVDVLAAADRISAPVLSIAGWHDPFLRTMLRLFERLTDDGHPGPREAHRLLIGPWTHEFALGVNTTNAAGSRGFGPASRAGRAGLKEHALGWFDRWLRDADPDPSHSPVSYFHMGRERWTSSATWPPAATRTQRWYLASGGHANGADGDGLLATRPVGMATSDTYQYDPADPAPTVGGRVILYHVPAGMQNQAPVQSREDVLVYTSPALMRPVEVLGQVTLELFVRSTAPTTDFVVVLSDVDEHGRAENVVEGAFQLPEGDHTTRPFAGVVDLWDTAYTFAAGHRLRVHITSSSFPRFARNRNVAGDAPPSSAAVAAQEVLHAGTHLSALVLQVASAPEPMSEA